MSLESKLKSAVESLKRPNGIVDMTWLAKSEPVSKITIVPGTDGNVTWTISGCSAPSEAVMVLSDERTGTVTVDTLDSETGTYGWSGQMPVYGGGSGGVTYISKYGILTGTLTITTNDVVVKEETYEKLTVSK